MALALESGPLFLAAAAVCGLGFGPAFGGIFRVLTTLAPADRRAEIVSSVLAVSYLAFSVPSVAAGIAVDPIGLRETAEIYGAVLVVIAALALLLTGRLEERAEPENELLAEA